MGIETESKVQPLEGNITVKSQKDVCSQNGLQGVDFLFPVLNLPHSDFMDKYWVHYSFK